MDKYIYNEKNGLWYELQGDYYLPCLKLPKEESRHIGVWGQRHLRYLKQYHRVRYYILLTSGKLNSYLADIDRQALNGTNIAKSNTGGAGIQKMNTDWLVIQDNSTPDGSLPAAGGDYTQASEAVKRCRYKYLFFHWMYLHIFWALIRPNIPTGTTCQNTYYNLPK